MVFDKLKFKAATVLAGKTYRQLAEKLGIDESTLYRKINAGGSFTRSEIGEMIQFLNIEDPMSIFFTEELADTQENN